MSHLGTRTPVHPAMFKEAMEQRDAALAEVARLREALEQVDGDVARRCAEAVAPLITALVHVVEECREEYCNVASGGPSACVVCSIARAALAAGKGGT